jgi:hypothetical protein
MWCGCRCESTHFVCSASDLSPVRKEKAQHDELLDMEVRQRPEFARCALGKSSDCFTEFDTTIGRCSPSGLNGRSACPGYLSAAFYVDLPWPPELDPKPASMLISSTEPRIKNQLFRIKLPKYCTVHNQDTG